MSVAACGGSGGKGNDEGDDKKMRAHVDYFAASSDADDKESDEEDKITLSDINPCFLPPKKRKTWMQDTGIGRSRSTDSLMEIWSALKKPRTPRDMIHKISPDTKLKITGQKRSYSAPPPAYIPALPPRPEDDNQNLQTDQSKKNKKKIKKK